MASSTDRAAAARRAQVYGPPSVPTLMAGPAEPAESGQPAVAAPLLEDVLKRLRKPPARDPFAALAMVADAVREAVAARRTQDAADALLGLVRQEVQLGEGPLRLQYDVTLRRLLAREILRLLAGLLLDPVYRREVMEIMQRAGAAGTEELLNALIEAPTFAERRALLDALRGMRQGTDILVRMLDHHQWFVVRNVADLVGDLRVEDSVDRLGEAVAHPDLRVRKSAAVALARIGTPAAVKHLWKALRDADPQVRAEAARAVKGKGFAALAMPLLSAAESEVDPAVKGEFYRALGRIGTPDAVQALKKAAAAGRAEAKKALDVLSAPAGTPARRP